MLQVDCTVVPVEVGAQLSGYQTGYFTSFSISALGTMTECMPESMIFLSHLRRLIDVNFEGGWLAPDSAVSLFRDVD